MSDAQKYRTKEEVEEYRKIDPITQVKEIIIQNNYASPDEILTIDQKVKQKVNEWERFADESQYPEKNISNIPF